MFPEPQDPQGGARHQLKSLLRSSVSGYEIQLQFKAILSGWRVLEPMAGILTSFMSTLMTTALE